MQVQMFYSILLTWFKRDRDINFCRCFPENSLCFVRVWIPDSNRIGFCLKHLMHPESKRVTNPAKKLPQEESSKILGIVKSSCSGLNNLCTLDIQAEKSEIVVF